MRDLIVREGQQAHLHDIWLDSEQMAANQQAKLLWQSSASISGQHLMLTDVT